MSILQAEHKHTGSYSIHAEGFSTGILLLWPLENWSAVKGADDFLNPLELDLFSTYYIQYKLEARFNRVKLVLVYNSTKPPDLIIPLMRCGNPL